MIHAPNLPGGDPGVVTALATTDGSAFRRFVVGLGMPGPEADDCVQEALTRLFIEVDRGALIANPRAWTYRVLFRVAMDEHRRRRRLVNLDEFGDIAAASDPFVGGSSIGSSIIGDVDLLSSRRRQVLRLRHIAGLSFAEIGATLGITASAARSHATHAVNDMRSRVGESRSSRVTPTNGLSGRRPEVLSAQRGLRTGIETVGELERPPGGLLEPGGIDIDPHGRIWVVDTARDAIAIFSSEGRFIERWGRAGSEPGQFTFRRALGNVGDVRFAADGGFYVADNGNQRIQRFDPTRQFVGAWGSRGRGPGQFLDPWSVRFDGEGHVFVSDALRGDIQVFTPDGRYLWTIGRSGSGRGQLDFQGDAIIVGDEVIVADHANCRISVFGIDGNFRRFMAEGELLGPDGLDLGPDGNLYVADTRGKRFAVIGRDGGVRHTWRGDAWLLRALPDGRILTSGRDGVQIHRVTPALDWTRSR